MQQLTDCPPSVIARRLQLPSLM